MENHIHPRKSLPLPTIRRYPLYLRALRNKIAEGMEQISSAALADELGYDAIMIRKDLALSGVMGRPRVGYPAHELARAITHALGWDDEMSAAIVGVGSLGHALLGFQGFADYNLKIALAFDIDPVRVGTTVHGVRVYHLDEMPQLIAEHAIKLGILTVPNSAAQACAKALVKAGVEGIWNFTTVQLTVPRTVKTTHVDLSESLAVLSHTIRQNKWRTPQTSPHGD